MARSLPPISTPANPAPRLGLLMGAILGLLSLPTIAFVALRGGYALNGGVLLLIFLVVAFALCFVAGLLAARRTGRVGSGAVAGLIAGAVAAFIAICLGTVILLLLAPYMDLNTLRAARAAGDAIGRARRAGPLVGVIRLALGGVILTAVGVVAGALGALVGRIGARPAAGVGPAATGPARVTPGYDADYAALTSAAALGTGARAHQTPMPSRANPQSNADQSDYAISYPTPGAYPTPPTILAPYRGDDPTTPMPYPHLPTPIPEPPPSTSV